MNARAYLGSARAPVGSDIFYNEAIRQRIDGRASLIEAVIDAGIMPGIKTHASENRFTPIIYHEVTHARESV